MKKVAVIGLKRIGDAVYTLPLIQSLSEQLPSTVTVFTEPQVKDLYASNPFVQEVKSFSKNQFWSETLKHLKQGGFDICIVLHNAFKYALLPFLAGVPVRVGYKKEMRAGLLTHKLPLPDKVIHRLEHNARLGDLVGVDARGILPRVYFSDEEMTTNSSLLKQFDLEPKRYIAMIVGSIAETRRWFPENFADVAKKIHEKYGLKTIILGGPDDYDIGQNVLRFLSDDAFIQNLAGKTSLRETMRLFEQAKAVVTNDTGPMHVASAIGVPVVTWFGAANEDEIAPPSPGTQILNAHVFCSPCVKEICPQKTLECLHKVTPAWVLESVSVKIEEAND